MVKLIVDQGNTKTKIALFKGKDILKKTVLNNNINLSDWESKSNRSILSSVTDATLILSKFNNRVLVLDHTTSIPISNNYKSLQSLGNDRLAAVVGASLLFPHENILVIDAGTCITLDLITKDGYHGGSISPGIEMRFHALSTNTSRLPKVDIELDSKLIGQNTHESIQSGVLNGVLSEIDGMINRYKQQYSILKVIITGGDCDFFDKGLKSSIFADPDIVLKGLNEILDHNEEYY